MIQPHLWPRIEFVSSGGQESCVLSFSNNLSILWILNLICLGWLQSGLSVNIHFLLQWPQYENWVRILEGKGKGKRDRIDGVWVTAQNRPTGSKCFLNVWYQLFHWLSPHISSTHQSWTSPQVCEFFKLRNEGGFFLPPTLTSWLFFILKRQ